jgi:DNA-binding CsgD family transcriptional regulator
MAEITEAKIRQAIWMIKAKKTKKSICEHLGIAYNTKRLDQIIKDFHDRQEREADLKKKARSKIFSKTEKQSIADDYLSGDSQSAIAKRNYISPQRVKNILMEMNVPIRARGKGKAAKVDHVVQDLEVRFNKNDKVFYAPENCFATVREVYDEEYLEYLENGKQKWIELAPFNPDPKTGLCGKFAEPEKGVHYEIYWLLEGQQFATWKIDSLLLHRQKIDKVIEETGRESYLIYKNDDYGGYKTVTRDKLFPVKAG